MEDKIKNDLENENRNKESIDKSLKPKIPLRINKKLVVAVIFIFIILFVYSFMKAATPKQKVQQIKTEENITTLDDTTFTNNDILVEKESKKVQKEEAEKLVEEDTVKIEKKQEDNSLDQYILEQLQTDRDILRNYYSQMLQEEQDARTSTMNFKSFDTNKNSSSAGSSQKEANDKRSLNLAMNDPNRQSDKKEFLKAEEANMYYNSHSLVEQISSYEIKAGNIIPGVMITATLSDLPGYMLGQVREDVYDTVSGNILLIPKGTRIFGRYDSNVTFGQERILVVWQRLIFPNGKSLGLDNMAGTDLSGYAGFKGKVDNHYFKLLQAVVLSSFIGAGEAVITQDKYGDDDWRYEAGRGGGEVVLQFGDKMAERILDLQPSLSVPQGYKFNIIVSSDLILEPYEE